MEVKKDEGINIGENPFFQPSNSIYGTNWKASEGQNPVKMSDIPLYPDVVSVFILGHSNGIVANSFQILTVIGLKRLGTEELDSDV